MKVYKLTFCVLDFDEVGLEQSVDFIENAKYPNHCIGPQIVSAEERDIGEWTEDHPLNQGGFDIIAGKAKPRWIAEFEKIFEGAE